MSTDLTLQAATDSALVTLMLQHGLLVPGETGATAAHGVAYSHIGSATLDSVLLDGSYAWVGIDQSIFGEAQTTQLLVDLAPHLYQGPPLRIRLGGGGYSPDRVQAIKNERDRRIQSGGYKVVVGGVDKWFHSDVISRTQQIGLVMMGANLPQGMQWKTLDGSFVAMTPTLAQQVFAAAAASDQAHHAAAEAVIQSGGTVADVVWPPRFMP